MIPCPTQSNEQVTTRDAESQRYGNQITVYGYGQSLPFKHSYLLHWDRPQMCKEVLPSLVHFPISRKKKRKYMSCQLLHMLLLSCTDGTPLQQKDSQAAGSFDLAFSNLCKSDLYVIKLRRTKVQLEFSTKCSACGLST